MKFIKKIQIGDCTLYLADCRDIVPHLDKKEVSIVGDPPYGVPIMVDYDISRNGQRKKEGRANEGKKFKEVIGNDEEFDPTPYTGVKSPIDGNTYGGFKEVLLWGANHFAHRLPHNGRWLVWDKRCGVIPERTQADGEVAWCNEYGALRIIRHVWDGMVKDSERGVPRVHPTQKPIAVMRDCLKHIKGKLICDPYMGSGTTGVACIKEGRSFIGIELDPEYFAAACARIQATYAEPDLFNAPAPKPVQDSFLPNDNKPEKRKKKAVAKADKLSV